MSNENTTQATKKQLTWAGALNAHLEIRLLFAEYATGRNRYSLGAERTEISERTLRKSFQTLRPKTLAKATENIRLSICQILEKHGFDEEEQSAWVENFPQTPLSAMVYECQIPGAVAYPMALSFANQIDQLFINLAQARKADNLKQAVDHLSSCDWLDDQYFSDKFAENATANKKEILQQAIQRDDWQELLLPIATIAWNCMMSLLALWDREFCTKQLPRLKTSPVFGLLLPAADMPLGALSKQRGMFVYPVRRLIDLTYALSQYAKYERWPEKRPAVKDLAPVTGDEEQSLINWRDGTKHFRFRDFENLWSACFENDHEDTKRKMGPLAPLYCAAVIFQNHLAKIDTKSKRREINVIDDQYLFWWTRHNQVVPDWQGKIDLPDWLNYPEA